MELGFIGLGRMGMNMVIRLVQGGHRVIVYNRSPEKVREAEGHGAVGASSVAEAVAAATGWPLLDDELVLARSAGAPAEQLLASGGEAALRDSAAGPR